MENQQEIIDEVYDNINDLEEAEFNRFLKERKPPMKPEKFTIQPPIIDNGKANSKLTKQVEKKVENIDTNNDINDDNDVDNDANDNNDNDANDENNVVGSSDKQQNKQQYKHQNKHQVNNKNVNKDDNIMKQPTKKQIKKSLHEQTKRIAKQAEKLKRAGEFEPDYEYIENNMDFFNKFLLHDNNFDRDMNITQIMHDWTNFKYSPFSELRTNYLKQISERVVCIEELGKLFKYNFITYMNKTNYRFDSLSFELCKYIGTTNDKDKIPFNFEYQFIHSMLSKLLVCMLSNVDRCFTNNKVQININFKKAIQTYLNEFAHILETKNKISTSWEVFEHCLLSSSHDTQIYVFKGSDDLKSKIKECFIDMKSDKPQFLLEQLIGNTLKTFIPTIAYSYFSVIKNIYIMGRLISIYMNKHLNEGKTRKQIIYDLYVISNTLTVEYEVNYLANLNTRSAPICADGSEMNKQTEMYYINHLIAGPQYYILKQLELSLPTMVQYIYRKHE